MIEKQVALVTGGATGIGAACCRALIAEGFHIGIHYNKSAKRAQQLLEEIKDGFLIQADLSDLEQVDAMIGKLKDAAGRVDVLVNNAGFGAVGPVAALPVERQMDMVQVNVAALTHLTRLLLPGMIERGRGGILNVGSTAGFQPGPNMAVYYATKAFVLSFTEALAEELVGSSVKATCLAPGPTATEFGVDSGMEKFSIFKFGTMNAKTVAQAGYRGFRRGKVIVIPGLTNKLGAFSVRFVPRAWVRKLVKRLQS